MEWKAIPGYPAYEVSDSGDVRRIAKANGTNVGKILKPQSHGRGYFHHSLSVGSIINTILTHRIVAQAFISNPEKKPQVDHINRNRADNRVENLRWVSSSEQNINKADRPNTSGHKHIYKHSNRWEVQIQRQKQIVFREYFPTIEEAVEARDAFLAHQS